MANIPIFSGKGEYIIINKDTYVAGASESFSEYKFVLNRQGGANSYIKFAKIFGNYILNDSVEYYIDDRKVWAGYVSTVQDNGLNIQCVPLWYKLTNQTIQGALILESTLSVYDAVVSLQSKIEDIGINFVAPDDIYKTYNVTTSFGGRNIADILDTIKEACPSTTVWGVDVNNIFYFKSFSEEAIDVLDWYENDFSDSDYSRDASGLYTGYVIKRKKFNSEDNETLPEIVGETLFDPPAFITEIGKRIGLFEYPYSLSGNNVAYNYAYHILMKQVIKETITLKKVHRHILINNAYKCILKPIENYYRDIDIGIKVDAKRNVHNFLLNDNLFNINDVIGSFELAPGIDTVISGLPLKEVDAYYKIACNECTEIYSINLVWKSTIAGVVIHNCIINVSDGTRNKDFYSVNNRAVLDVRGFDKRRIVISADIEEITFESMRVYFVQGSTVKTQNVINIDYIYKNGILEVNAKLSALNSKNISYFFNEQEKIKKLEQLFSN